MPSGEPLFPFTGAAPLEPLIEGQRIHAVGQPGEGAGAIVRREGGPIGREGELPDFFRSHSGLAGKMKHGAGDDPDGGHGERGKNQWVQPAIYHGGNVLKFVLIATK